MRETTVLHKLVENEKIHPNLPAYYVKREGIWEPTTWKEYAEQVRQAAGALVSLGFVPGDCVCILGFNRPEWIILCLSSMMAGGHSAGIYATNSPPEVAYVIGNAEARFILVENEKQWNKVRQVRDHLPDLTHIIMMQGVEIEDSQVLNWDTFMSKGEEIDRSIIDERLAGIKLDQLATLIYTSGTTGPPKGVMLSHKNLVWTAQTGIDLFNIGPTDSVLSYLPLSHIAEQMFTVHTPVTAGLQVYFAEYPPQKFLNKNFREASPTIVFGVPRVWERFADGIEAKIEESSGLQQRIAHWALNLGKEVSTLKNRGEKPRGLLALQYKIADRFVFSTIKKALGLSRARYCLSGAAPISPEVVEFLNSVDIPLMEIYGQSEDSGPTTVSRPGANRIGKVGQAWPGTEVKLAEDGEILIKGPNVFMGYYKNPEATASDLVDGWLHTGDLGEFDDDGFLTIIGRKKDIFITSGGLNIAPKNIESALIKIPLVSNAVCIGDKRRYITALLTLNLEVLEKFCHERSLKGEGLHAHPEVIAEIQLGIEEKVNSTFSRAEHVRDFRILPRDFSMKEGELTPTLKVKRQVVNEHFHEEIASMYPDE